MNTTHTQILVNFGTAIGCVFFNVIDLSHCIDVNQADLVYLLGDMEQQRCASALFLIKLKEQRVTGYN